MTTEPRPTVLLRCDGAVDEDTLAYAQAKIDALAHRSGLPAITGEIRIVGATVHHAGRPWSATADLYVGGRHIVATAEEATGTELVDRLQDRLRRQTENAAHRHGHHTAAPPWRATGGTTRTAVDTAGTAEGSHTA